MNTKAKKCRSGAIWSLDFVSKGFRFFFIKKSQSWLVVGKWGVSPHYFEEKRKKNW